MASLPDVEDGIEYWNTQPASLDGVLGKPTQKKNQILDYITLAHSHNRWIWVWGNIIQFNRQNYLTHPHLSISLFHA
jgi:hypothetical protein